MAIIALPTISWAMASAEFIDNNVIQKPPGGGVAQTLQRLGSRWALTVTLPKQPEGTTWQGILAAIIPARAGGASYPWPQPGVAILAPVSGLQVNGANQTGTVLLVKNGNSADRVKAGQFVSIPAGGRNYLYMVTADMAAPSGGLSSLALYPPLRASPANSAAIEVNAPRIEGNLTDNFGWDHDITPRIGLKFRIEEIA